MNNQKTIEMTPRELALYNAGESIGHARGLEEASKYIADLAAELKKQDGAQTLRAWLDATARGVGDQRKGLTPKQAKELASGLRLLGIKSATELQEGIVQFVERGAESVKAQAAMHRQHFAQFVAQAGQASTGIAKRIAQRIVDAL